MPSLEWVDHGGEPFKSGTWECVFFEDGSFVWRAVESDEFIDAIRHRNEVRDKSRVVEPKPKSKPWVAMNQKPAWLGRK